MCRLERERLGMEDVRRGCSGTSRGRSATTAPLQGAQGRRESVRPAQACRRRWKASSTRLSRHRRGNDDPKRTNSTSWSHPLRRRPTGSRPVSPRQTGDRPLRPVNTSHHPRTTPCLWNDPVPSQPAMSSRRHRTCLRLLRLPPYHPRLISDRLPVRRCSLPSRRSTLDRRSGARRNGRCLWPKDGTRRLL